MHRSHSVLFRLIVSQWLAVIYGAGVMFFLMAFLARKLGPSSWAIFLYVQAIAAIFAVLQDGGFQTLIFREKVCATDAKGLCPNALISGYFTYVTGITLLGALVVLVSGTAFKMTFLLALIYFAFRCFTNIISSLLKGQGAFTREAVWRFQVNTFIAVPVVLLLSLGPPSPDKVFLGFIIGQMLLLATRKGRDSLSRPKTDFPVESVWKNCFPFMIINGATIIYFKSDIVLLKHFQTDLNVVGYYGAAFQFVEGVILLATPIVHLLFRQMRLTWLDQEAFFRRLAAGLTVAVLIALVCVFAGVLFAPKLIVLIFGETYRPAAALLPLLLLTLIFLLPNFILTQGIIALNQERYYAIAASLCAVFNVGLNLFLIPLYSAKGAAVSTVATEAFLTLLAGGWLIRNRRRGMLWRRNGGKSEEQKKS